MGFFVRACWETKFVQQGDVHALQMRPAFRQAHRLVWHDETFEQVQHGFGFVAGRGAAWQRCRFWSGIRSAGGGTAGSSRGRAALLDWWYASFFGSVGGGGGLGVRGQAGVLDPQIALVDLSSDDAGAGGDTNLGFVGFVCSVTRDTNFFVGGNGASV